MIYLASMAYLAALVLANVLVAEFGPAASPYLAFLLIGFDLSVRDWLHVRLRPAQMLGLIVAAGLLTLALNPAAAQIAVASAIAFTSAALVDWATFARVRRSWLFRANVSNTAAAAVDSLTFPTIAFGALLPEIVALQFLAKVAGGAFWAWLIARFVDVGGRTARGAE